MTNGIRRQIRDFVLAKKEDNSHFEVMVDSDDGEAVTSALKAAFAGILNGHIPDVLHQYRPRVYVLSPTRWLIKQAVA